MDIQKSLEGLEVNAPRVLSIGVTGHREGNAAFDRNRQAIADTLNQLLTQLESRLVKERAQSLPVFRLVTNLAHGADLLAADIAVEKAWELVAPLPFGRDLNLALNTPHLDLQEISECLEGHDPQTETAGREWDRLRQLTEKAQCFELSEHDAFLRDSIKRVAADPTDTQSRRGFELLMAERSRVASMVTIEQSDLLIAIWDGLSPSASGGTRDTINKALQAGVQVVWLDAAQPQRLNYLTDPGDLAVAQERPEPEDADEIVDAIVGNIEAGWDAMAEAENQVIAHGWPPRSLRRFHAYRRIEAMFSSSGKKFGSLVQIYEPPDAIATGSAQPMMDSISELPGVDDRFVGAINSRILPRFAVADAMSTFLSDAYRGGMVASFLLSAAAIIGGIVYFPFFGSDLKWPFALLEFILLSGIVAITWAGTRGQWHRRWFQTRRVAEYLRHAPIMLALGCTRPIGRWPRSRDAQWPEQNARHLIMGIGLPRLQVSQAYLRAHLAGVVCPFLRDQRDYHREKSERLEQVHSNLDRMSEFLFILAIVSVGAYLILKLFAFLGLLDPGIPYDASKVFTFLGVAFPTLGAALAGIRYFGDFERFAAISEVTAEKLDQLLDRAALLLEGNEKDVSYLDFANLVHAMNDVVIEEIESWQSIFGTKKMAVPV